MKKIILAIALVVSFSYASLANNKYEVSAQTLAAFNKDFTGATAVSWEQETNYSKASFSLNGNILFAYYSNTGELIATARNITSSQLPIVLLNAIKSQYGSFWISDLFEMASNNSTSYYITLENADEKKILQSSGNGWETYHSIVKE